MKQDGTAGAQLPLPFDAEWQGRVFGSGPMARYTLEFYEDERGGKPVLRWIRDELTLAQRYELGQAMRAQLEEEGRRRVRATECGRPLGKGLFEFRRRCFVEPLEPAGAADGAPRQRRAAARVALGHAGKEERGSTPPVRSRRS